MRRIKNQILVYTGIGVSLFFLWISLRNTDYHEIVTAFSNSNPLYIIPFITSLFVYYALKAYRWKFILTPVTGTTAQQIYPPMMIGYAGSLVLPMQLGELLRIHFAAKILNVYSAPILVSVILEKLFDFLTLFLLIGITAFLLVDTSPALSKAAWFVGSICLLVFLFIGYYIIFTGQFIKLARFLVSVFPEKIRTLILRNLELGAEGLHSIKNPGLLMRISVLSIAQWAFMWLCIYLSILATGISVPYLLAFLVLVYVIIGVTLPTSPGYIGSIQAAYYFALSPYGVTAETAFTASLFYHLLAYFSVLIVGGYYLRSYGISFSKLKRSVERSTE